MVAANASNALTAHYTGSLQPIGIVKFQADRYIADAPLAGLTIQWPGLISGGNHYVGRKRMTAIVPADWTNVNHTATVTRYDGAGSIGLYDSSASTQQWRMVCRGLPTPPYTIRLHWIPEYAIQEGAAINHTGILLRNSTTGLLVSWSFGMSYGGTFYHQKWNSPSSQNSVYNSSVWRGTSGQDPITIQITDDTVTRSYLTWNRAQQLGPLQPSNSFWGTGVPRADFTLPDQICFGIKNDNGNYNNFATFAGYDVNPTW